mgnify:CR=1 FL=1
MSINDTSAVIYPDVDLPEFNAIDRKSKDNGDILYILVPKDRPEVCPECGSVSVHVHRSCKIHSGQRSGLYSRSGTPSSFLLHSVSSIRLLSKNGHKKRHRFCTYGVHVEQQKRDTIDENGIPAL